jgi:ATP-binding cassette subfamily B protein
VLDDISSALDVETEHMLWKRLFDRQDTTVLAVSHRPEVLKRADRIVVLEDGHVEAIGPLEHLLHTSSELQKIWRREVAPT